MATSTPTISRIKAPGITAVRGNTVFTRKFTFTVPTSAGAGDGYYSGDTIKLSGIVPEGCAIQSALYKTSASQGATLTFAASVDGQTAFVSATNLTATVPTALTVVPANAFASTSGGDINLILAGTTVGTTAATITLYLTLAAFDAPATITTYTA